MSLQSVDLIGFCVRNWSNNWSNFPIGHEMGNLFEQTFYKMLKVTKH